MSIRSEWYVNQALKEGIMSRLNQTNVHPLGHYLDSVNRTARRDPLLRSQYTRKGSKRSWSYTTVLLVVTAAVYVYAAIQGWG